MARKPIAYEARAHAILAAILAELFVARVRQADITPQPGCEAKLSERVQIAIECMTRFGQDRIGLKEIAGRVGLSLHYFARKFRREVGMAPIQYLNRFRIEQAKRLLATSTKTVGDVGRLVGIPDSGYFSRLFRKLAGESPGIYRKMNQHQK
ncbi:MAG: helix-turn-helix transcriptional regulator [Verrucomicrobia bacterium]|nr:helix-turn-helix transcriptional regulator [Verrucomicrobiota bacterium]